MSTEEQDRESEYEQWINSFSGLEGRGSIGRKPTPVEAVDFSEFVTAKKKWIGE